MDEFKNTRQILNEVCAQADQVKADCERWAHERRQQQQAKFVRKDYPGDDQFNLTPAEQPQATMDELSSRAWNTWAQEIAMREAAAAGLVLKDPDHPGEVLLGMQALYKCLDAVKEGQREARMKQDAVWHAEIGDLKAEGAALRFEIDELRTAVEQTNGSKYLG